MEHKSVEIELSKELTLKAIEQGLLKVSPVEAENSETAGKRVADFYNAILENLKI